MIKKSSAFQWNEEQEKAFNSIKDCHTNAPLLLLPDFNKMFEVECDASGVGIRAILTPDGKPISYFSKKLNEATLNYPIYDKKMYALIQALETWQHYLWPKEFVIHSDHEALKHINGQNKLNKRHAKYTLLSYLDSKLLGFAFLKDLYSSDVDFGELYVSCEHIAIDKFYRHEGFLFREGKLCIPRCSIRDLLVNEVYSRGLMGHFRVGKILEMLKEHFYWPRMKRNVERVCDRYVTYLIPLPNDQFIHADVKRKVEYVKELHKKVRANIEARTKSYVQNTNKGRKRVVFEYRDWVWVHMRRSVSQPNKGPNYCHEETVLFKFWSQLMRILTSLTCQLYTLDGLNERCADGLAPPSNLL
ncbi:uncharacterized protein [Gossypium hirsutum]|uniref:Retrovirus-related Pol polyprotein from transposon 17.6 n=1 Tax=Gossypium hirsutum TaxID=3635 RepID=A0A1U8HVC6_GOSHI|nr:uncharacterized protein LOC107889951 [Gossypium hirsutum]